MSGRPVNWHLSVQRRKAAERGTIRSFWRHDKVKYKPKPKPIPEGYRAIPYDEVARRLNERA